MRFTKRHTVAAFAFVAIATLGLSACSGAADMTEGTSPTTPATSSSEPSTPAMTADPAANLVGPGCAGYAEANPTGPGSVVGMSADPVAVAASNNPLLTTLVAAVSGQLNPEVDLVDTLNGSEFTVFAPVDDAFAQIDPATIDMLKTPEGADTLSKILTYHVVAGQIMPDELMGDLETVEGGTVNITGSGDKLQVNGANVICGGVQTANATVYLIDTVLMPGN